MYENKTDLWLRWCAQGGNLILIGGERAKQEHRRVERFAEKLRVIRIQYSLTLTRGGFRQGKSF